MTKKMMMMRLVMANLFLKYSVVTALESYVKGHGTPGKLGMSGLVKKEDKIIVLGKLAQYQHHIPHHHHHHHHYQKACSCGLQGFSTSFMSCVIHVCYQTSSGNSRYGSLMDHHLLAIYQFAFAIAYTEGWKRAYHCFLLLK